MKFLVDILKNSANERGDNIPVELQDLIKQIQGEKWLYYASFMHVFSSYTIAWNLNYEKNIIVWLLSCACWNETVALARALY
jgi:hypothetical protein